MRRRIMILDGYNILHRVPAWRVHLEPSLETAREVLLAYCRHWMSRRRDVWLFCVVFDGDSSVAPGRTSAGAGVRVVFSPTGQTADDRILEILREFGEGFDYVVVSHDRYVVTRAELLEADVMAPRAFAKVLHRVPGDSIPRSGSKGRLSSRGAEAQASESDALAPEAASAITEQLRKLWGG